MVNLYNQAVVESNSAANKLNEFIFYRNRGLTPKKSEAETRKMLIVTEEKLKKGELLSIQIEEPTEEIKNMRVTLNTSISQMLGQVNEQKTFLNAYYKVNAMQKKK